MNVRLEDLKHLPLAERLQLVEDLWDSIAAELESVPLSDSLKEEMDRRLEEYLEDPSSAVPYEEVKRRMKEKR